MDEESRVEIVDRYLLDQMNPGERKDFEKMLAGDHELRLFVDNQRKLINGLGRYQERKAFLDMLSQVKNEQPKKIIAPIIDSKPEGTVHQKQSAKVRQLLWRLAYAAGFVLIITALIFVLRKDVSPATLATNNFAFHADILSTNIEASGATEDVNQKLLIILHEGIQAYNQGTYGLAEKKFEDFRSQAKGRNYLVILNDFYLAQIALFNDRTDLAISLLEPIQIEEGLPIEKAVNWYLALAHLKKGERTKSQELLKTLKSDAAYGEKANLILNKL